MTRTALTVVLGLGLLGGMLASGAQAALPYSTSTLNWDGSRTMCGPYGCTTVPSSSLYRTGYIGNDYFYHSRYGNNGCCDNYSYRWPTWTRDAYNTRPYDSYRYDYNRYDYNRYDRWNTSYRNRYYY